MEQINRFLALDRKAAERFMEEKPPNRDSFPAMRTWDRRIELAAASPCGRF